MANEPEWCFECDDYYANCYGHRDTYEEDEEDGCMFGDKCIMAFDIMHTSVECYTSEVALEDQIQSRNKTWKPINNQR